MKDARDFPCALLSSDPLRETLPTWKTIAREQTGQASEQLSPAAMWQLLPRGVPEAATGMSIECAGQSSWDSLELWGSEHKTPPLTTGRQEPVGRYSIISFPEQRNLSYTPSGSSEGTTGLVALRGSQLIPTSLPFPLFPVSLLRSSLWIPGITGLSGKPLSQAQLSGEIKWRQPFIKLREGGEGVKESFHRVEVS